MQPTRVYAVSMAFRADDGKRPPTKDELLAILDKVQEQIESLSGCMVKMLVPEPDDDFWR